MTSEGEADGSSHDPPTNHLLPRASDLTHWTNELETCTTNSTPVENTDYAQFLFSSVPDPWCHSPVSQNRRISLTIPMSQFTCEGSRSEESLTETTLVDSLEVRSRTCSLTTEGSNQRSTDVDSGNCSSIESGTGSVDSYQMDLPGNRTRTVSTNSKCSWPSNVVETSIDENSVDTFQFPDNRRSLCSEEDSDEYQHLLDHDNQIDNSIADNCQLYFMKASPRSKKPSDLTPREQQDSLPDQEPLLKGFRQDSNPPLSGDQQGNDSHSDCSQSADMSFHQNLSRISDMTSSTLASRPVTDSCSKTPTDGPFLTRPSETINHNDTNKQSANANSDSSDHNSFNHSNFSPLLKDGSATEHITPLPEEDDQGRCSGPTRHNTLEAQESSSTIVSITSVSQVDSTPICIEHSTCIQREGSSTEPKMFNPPVSENNKCQISRNSGNNSNATESVTQTSQEGSYINHKPYHSSKHNESHPSYENNQNTHNPYNIRSQPFTRTLIPDVPHPPSVHPASDQPSFYPSNQHILQNAMYWPPYYGLTQPAFMQPNMPYPPWYLPQFDGIRTNAASTTPTQVTGVQVHSRIENRQPGIPRTLATHSLSSSSSSITGPIFTPFQSPPKNSVIHKDRSMTYNAACTRQAHLGSNFGEQYDNRRCPVTSRIITPDHLRDHAPHATRAKTDHSSTDRTHSNPNNQKPAKKLEGFSNPALSTNSDCSQPTCPDKAHPPLCHNENQFRVDDDVRNKNRSNKCDTLNIYDVSPIPPIICDTSIPPPTTQCPRSRPSKHHGHRRGQCQQKQGPNKQGQLAKPQGPDAAMLMGYDISSPTSRTQNNQSTVDTVYVPMQPIHIVTSNTLVESPKTEQIDLDDAGRSSQEDSMSNGSGERMKVNQPYQPGAVLSVSRQCLPSEYDNDQDEQAAHWANQDSPLAEWRGSGSSSSFHGGQGKRSAEQMSPNTSQTGLLSDREQNAKLAHSRHTPTYLPLSVVACVFNPVLGLLSLLMNSWAKKEFKVKRRYARANSLYLISILLSVLAIFVTLTVIVLLLGEFVVLRPKLGSEKAKDVVDTRHCLEKLLGDKSMESMKYYNLDLETFCRLVDNFKLMDALEHYKLMGSWVPINKTKELLNKENQRYFGFDSDNRTKIAQPVMQENLGTSWAQTQDPKPTPYVPPEIEEILKWQEQNITLPIDADTPYLVPHVTDVTGANGATVPSVNQEKDMKVTKMEYNDDKGAIGNVTIPDANALVEPDFKNLTVTSANNAVVSHESDSKTSNDDNLTTPSVSNITLPHENYVKDTPVSNVITDSVLNVKNTTVSEQGHYEDVTTATSQKDTGDQTYT